MLSNSAPEEYLSVDVRESKPRLKASIISTTEKVAGKVDGVKGSSFVRVSPLQRRDG